MQREPERPSNFGDAELEHLERRLTEWLQRVRQAREYVKNRGDIWVFKAPTLKRALYCWSQWVESLVQSLDSAAAGDPIDESTTKSRGKQAKKRTNARKNATRKKR